MIAPPSGRPVASTSRHRYSFASAGVEAPALDVAAHAALQQRVFGHVLEENAIPLERLGPAVFSWKLAPPLGPARVALLSYSTGRSGSGPGVEMVRAAAEATGFLGPVQADAALNARIAAKKGAGAGDANVLIFPSLDAGNIAYKLAQELAGAQAIGPFLQGFRRPVCDLSRGATVADIVAATVVTLAL